MASLPGRSALDRPRRSHFPIAAFLVLALAATAGMPFGTMEHAAAASVTINLYAATPFGWSTTPGSETNPGPTLTVDQGDEVTIHLTSEDGLEHGLFIDYNRNRAIDASDFVSPTTQSTISFTFTAQTAGVFPYFCSVHSDDLTGSYDPVLSLMRGTWVTNSPPSATIITPAGGESWTGGTAHDIVFEVGDSAGDTLAATLEYSYGGGAGGGVIRQSFTPGPNPNVVSWTPSGFTATDTFVRLTVEDATGDSVVVNSPLFEVDSVAPMIEVTSPADGATDVGTSTPIRVTWSEPMDLSATGTSEAFGLRATGNDWVPGSFSWSADGRQMTFQPAAPLSPGTVYQARVNGTAEDDSVPGNRVDGNTVWIFTTRSEGDQTPPVVSQVRGFPSFQQPGGFVEIFADVQDAGGLAGVSAHVVGPSFDENLTMAPGSGSLWAVNRTYAEIGEYGFTVWALDTSGNVGSGSEAFEIGTGTPGPGPALPAPASVTLSVGDDGKVRVSWTPVSAADLAGYHIYRSDVSGGPYRPLTLAPVAASAPPTYTDTTVQLGGTYFYVVTAVNTTGFESPYSEEETVTVPAFREPLFDPVPWAIAGVTIGVMLGAMYGLVWRRRPA